MEGMRSSLLWLVVGAIIGAGAFGAGYGLRVATAPAAGPTIEYHNNTEYRNVTNWQNRTVYVYPNASAEPPVTDLRTEIRTDFPAPCTSYVTTRYTGVQDRIEFWVSVESMNLYPLAGAAYHVWRNGTAVHNETIFVFDLGTPAGGLYSFNVSHPDLSWPSRASLWLYCGSGSVQKPLITFTSVSFTGGNASMTVAGASLSLAPSFYRVNLAVNGTVGSAVAMPAASGSYVSVSVGGTPYRVYWVDIGGEATVNSGDLFRVTGDNVPLPGASSFTFYLLWAADGSQIQSVIWATS